MEKRQLWFITRPERDPKFHKDALIALQKSTDNFKAKWSKNRSAHLAYEKELVHSELKRDNISKDGSGGRTWAAMLRTFSYVYIDGKGYLRATKSGLAILSDVKVRENVSKQILTLQIPNAYFLSTGFKPKYDEGFQIRPARFLIKLASKRKLDFYITKDEITFFALSAKADNQIDDVARNILKYRALTEELRKHSEDSIAIETDHRARLDSSARDFKASHGDVAHTFMLLCEYTELVGYERGNRSRLFVPENMQQQVESVIAQCDVRYPINKRYKFSLERMAENNGLDVDSYKSNSFLSSVSPATNISKTDNKIKNLLAKYPVPSELSLCELKIVLSQEFSEKESARIIPNIKNYIYQTLNLDFVEDYLSETNPITFEDKTGQIFNLLGFDVTMRPVPPVNTTTSIEISAEYSDTEFGIIDAKNYLEKFALTSALASHMASEYIPNYENYNGKKIVFFGYVISSQKLSGAKNLEKISKLVKRDIPNRNIKGFMITATTLVSFLDYCLDNEISRPERKELFMKAINNSAYSSIEDFIKSTGVEND